MMNHAAQRANLGLSKHGLHPVLTARADDIRNYCMYMGQKGTALSGRFGA
jgi:hypothetical protein